MDGRIFSLRFHDRDAAPEPREVTIRRTVIAGWTGRDRSALEKHIDELAALGVKRPASTPMFYRVSTARVTLDAAIEATGDASSGEVEFIVLREAGRLWIGVGSDHTDREVETYGVTVSKQMCDKPIAADFWAFDDVKPHWDKLVLRAHVTESDSRSLYQEGNVNAMLDPDSLIERYAGHGGIWDDGCLMFCGTLAAKGGIRPAERFDFELFDPVCARSIRHAYAVVTLPVMG